MCRFEQTHEQDIIVIIDLVWVEFKSWFRWSTLTIIYIYIYNIFGRNAIPYINRTNAN